MSWYSDKEKFNEFDDPYCIRKNRLNRGQCGKTKEECDRCLKDHMEEEKEMTDIR